jgi:hypothetical protein
MILKVFDPRLGRRIAIEVREADALARTEPCAVATSGNGPEHRQKAEHDHNEDQQKAQHAAAAKKLPRETFQDHAALDPVGE